MKSLNEFFDKEGYSLYICSTDRRFFSFVQEENYVVNVLCFFDESTETSTQAQMQAFLDAHRERISYGRDKDIHFLKIMIVSQEGVGRIYPGPDPDVDKDADGEIVGRDATRWVGDVWYIIRDEELGSRLFVPPGAVEDFYGIRKRLEEHVAAEGASIYLPAPDRAPAESIDRAPASQNDDGSVTLRKEPAKKVSVPWITVGLILVNLTMFIIKHLGFIDVTQYSLTNGIMDKPDQWYRFLTYMFLHENEVHLMNNMIMLYAAGSLIEGMINRAYFTVLYFVSGIGGGILSTWYNTKTGEPYYSIGASGAVYGIMGAIIAVMLISGLWRVRGMVMRIMIVLALLFVTTSSAGRIDVADHMGGFVSGMIMCGIYLIFRYSSGRKQVRE